MGALVTLVTGWPGGQVLEARGRSVVVCEEGSEDGAEEEGEGEGEVGEPEVKALERTSDDVEIPADDETDDDVEASASAEASAVVVPPALLVVYRVLKVVGNPTPRGPYSPSSTADLVSSHDLKELGSPTLRAPWAGGW